MKKLILLPVAFALAWPLEAATKTATLVVKGWTCGSCAAATRIALKKLDGVEDARTNLDKKQAVVTYDDAKVQPEKMVQVIEKLGYKATVVAATWPSGISAPAERKASLDSPALSERVSFFEVPLECGAVEGLGCGSASKPVLRVLDRNPAVKEAKINYAGTVLVVVWNDPAQSRSGGADVEAAFKARNLETALLEGRARDKALKEYGSAPWFGANEVDRLSEREAQVIATRLLNRAKAGLNFSPEKLAALTKDLTGGIAAILTRDKGEECARDPFEELTKIAGKHLNPQQLAELRKAAEQGAGALPGEAR